MKDNFAFAIRTEPFQESVIREMTRLCKKVDAINLSQGIPDFDAPSDVLEAAIAAIRNGANQYTFPFGLLPFREAIALKTMDINHIHADAENDVTVTVGVSEAIMSTVLALTDPGDEVIIIEPWYENYVPVCYLAGVTPRFISLHEPDYTIDKTELQKRFNSRTRLILINTPHNPTGRVFSYDELEIIAQLCQKYGVIAVTDEIYEHIIYPGHSHISIGSLPGMEGLSVTISGLGKSYSLTGWRVGWTVAASSLTARIRKVHDYLTICAPSPFQVAGITALQLPKDYYQQLVKKYMVRGEILYDALDEVGLCYRPCEGAYYLMVDFKSINWPCESYSKPGWTRDRAFAEYMAREVGVAIVPGSSFYQKSPETLNRSEHFVRFNFARHEDTLSEASRRIRAHIRS